MYKPTPCISPPNHGSEHVHAQGLLTEFYGSMGYQGQRITDDKLLPLRCCNFTTYCPFEWGLCEYVIVRTILGGSPVILWISLGSKPKWLPLKFGYHDVMRTSPIHRETRLLYRGGVIAIDNEKRKHNVKTLLLGASFALGKNGFMFTCNTSYRDCKLLWWDSAVTYCSESNLNHGLGKPTLISRERKE